MLEAGVAVGTALITGMAVLTQKVHSRITELDRRVDSVELTIAQDYVSKQDLSEIMARVEAHMVRIENKLDRLVLPNAPK